MVHKIAMEKEATEPIPGMIDILEENMSVERYEGSDKDYLVFRLTDQPWRVSVETVQAFIQKKTG